ncbi:MAG TPA: aminotransferase class III-fold pyridoxal phosphate-dependent enzyme [Terriglobia bacterium]|nr:aminotransferase class III-fold pyridoxal phosphate-dependent enzyme [Terriglobia bacterium]
MATSSVVHLLRERAAELPSSRSYTFLAGGKETENLTFSQLDRRARAIGAHLQQLGGQGERALLLYPAGVEYICAFYGCLAAGAVAVPAYPPRLNRNLRRLEAILEDASPMLALTTDSVFRQIRDRFDEAPRLARLKWVITDQVPIDSVDTWIDPNITENTLAFLQYTSASTSSPKGVMVSHGNILHNQLLMKEAVQHGRDTVVVSWLPLFHDMGLISMVLASLYNGASCYLLSPVDFLKRPRLWLEAISRYRGTFSGAPDFGYQLCIDRIGPQDREGLDLSSWRVAFNGSEPVRAETLSRFVSTFGSCGLPTDAMFPCYGLAENTLFAAGRFHKAATAFSRVSLEEHRPRPANGHQGDQGVQLVSCGTPLLGSRLVIADPATGRSCDEGEVGEIWLASPSVAHGYWNQPDASRQTFRALLANGDGPFLRTGDLGFIYLNEVYVTGRIKDLIILRGRNLIPQDIEQTVEGCDAAIRPTFVAAVSVEAQHAERLVVAAEIRREARRELDTNALIERIRSAVAAEYEVEVSAVVLLRPGTLPKTSSGKTQRAVVRQEFLAGDLRAVAEWRDEAVFPRQKEPVTARNGRGLDRLENWLVERLAVRAKMLPDRINRDGSILVYGLDSVEVVSILGEIEETFGVEVDVERLFEGEPSLRQLVQRIRGNHLTGSTPALAAKPLAMAAAAGKQVEQIAPIVASAGTTTLPPPKTTAKVSIPPSDRDISVRSQPIRPTVLPDGASARREHPFRTCVNPELGRMLAQLGMDKTFVRGDGSWLWDDTGRRYLDFLAQYGALPFGFNPPRIWAALNAVRDEGEPSFVQPSYLNAAGELASRLLAAAPPGMAYVTFVNSGAEAVEAAIKLCRSITGRLDILSAGNGFHGKTLGALSATPKEKYQKPFGAPVPGFDHVPYGDIEALRRALSTGRYAGFLVEPVQGEGGIVEPPAGYLRLARKACRDVSTVFVADEIQTGLGRTGAMFVCRELGITPDVMTVAKALGGGLMPIGACLATAAAYNDEFALKHTSTFAGNTLACRAGLATLNLLEENGGALIRGVAENGARLKEGLQALGRRYPGLIAEVRGRGYLLGLRFGLDRHSLDEGLLGYLGEQEALTALVVSHLLHVEGVRVGCTLNHGGVIRIEPPLTATWEECQFFLQAVERVLSRIQQRNLAALTSQVTGFRPSAAAEVQKPGMEAPGFVPRGRRLEVRSDEGRFAFLVHPLTWKDYADLDRGLSVLSEDQLAALSTAFADNFDPLVIGETRVRGKNGKAAYGEFILVPRRAEELRAMTHRDAVKEILQAVQLAQKRGARIVGLGAYTSVVTQGGLSLKGFGLPSLTTGNSYTAVAARETVRLAAAQRRWTLARRTVGIIGAGGAVGQALSILLSPHVGRLVLLGNPAHPEQSHERLLQVTGRIAWCLEHLRGTQVFHQGSVASWADELAFDTPEKPDRTSLIRIGKELISRTGSVVVSVDAASLLPEVDIVVCCTSSTERLVREESLRPSAVVCDVSRPSNVGVEVLRRRPDVMVLNGGVVRMPPGTSLGFNASLGKGNAYACMAETMMLAMEQRYEDTSLGFDLRLEQVLEMERLAEELGFRVLLDRKEDSSKRDGDDHADDFAGMVDFATTPVSSSQEPVCPRSIVDAPPM